jgi:hypothetical protein
MSDPFSEGVRQTLAIISDHWPEIGVDVSDSTWLECICGWDSTVQGSIDWYQHLDNAVDEAIGVKARSNVGLVHEHGPLSWTSHGWKCDICGKRPVVIKP